MKPCSSLRALGAIPLVALCTATGQNLDFEAATVPPTPAGSWGGGVSATDAFPGWTIDFSPSPGWPTGFMVLYNNLTLGTPAVDLIGPEFPNALGLMPLEGNYSAVLQSFPYSGAVSLSCSVWVPSYAHSVTLLVGNNASAARLSLSGVNIPLLSIGGGRLAGDITSFADSNAELRISADSAMFYFDDIEFSSQFVPEPAPIGIVCAGVGLGFFFISQGRTWVNRTGAVDSAKKGR